MKKILLACLLAASAITGLAAPQASNGKDVVTLREPVCSSPEVLANIPAEYKPLFHNAEALVNGVQYKACWFLQEDNVIVVYSDGDFGVIPAALFKEAGV